MSESIRAHLHSPWSVNAAQKYGDCHWRCRHISTCAVRSAAAGRCPSLSNPPGEEVAAAKPPLGQGGQDPAMVPGHARIVVVGGGITGCSIAYHLARAGARGVVLVEKGELTSGTTFHSVGLVSQFRTSPADMLLMHYSIRLYGELAAEAILRAFRAGRFEAHRFRGYERAVRRGTRPFERFIESYYDRAFLEVFMRPKNVLGVVPAVTGILAGGSFGLLPRHLHLSLWFFHQVVRLTRWSHRRRGIVLESRLDW